MIVYKILTAEQFSALQADTFEGAPIDITDGYIHLSMAEQVQETLEKHFAGQEGLVIAAVSTAALGDALRWEPSRGGALFPHFYGRLTMAAVTAHAPVAFSNSGVLVLPQA